MLRQRSADNIRRQCQAGSHFPRAVSVMYDESSGTRLQRRLFFKSIVFYERHGYWERRKYV